MGLDLFQWRVSKWISVNRSALFAFCLRVQRGSTQHGLPPVQAPHSHPGSIPAFGMLSSLWAEPAQLRSRLLSLPTPCMCALAIMHALRVSGRVLVLLAAMPFPRYLFPALQIWVISWAGFWWWCFGFWFLVSYLPETLGWDREWSWKAALLHLISPVSWHKSASLGLGERGTFSNSSTQRGHIFLVCSKALLVAALSFPPSSALGIPAYHLRRSSGFWPLTGKSSLPSVAQPEWVCVFKLPPHFTLLHAFRMAAISVNCNCGNNGGSTWLADHSGIYQSRTGLFSFNLRMSLKSMRTISGKIKYSDK